MANIKLKSSSVTGRIPLITDLAYGELALNYADKKLYFKSSTNSIETIGGGTSGDFLPLTGGTLSGVLAINSGAGYTLQLASSQRYQFRIQNTSATAQTAGWWLAHDVGGNLFIHADGVGDVASITSGGTFNATNLTLGGNQVLHANNYSYYALPLTGGTLSGAVITQTAATSWGVYSKTVGYGNDSGIWFSANVGELILRKADGTIATRIAADGSYAFINNNNILHAGNYSSYSPTLTGGGASGTWGISITGNSYYSSYAGTATLATTLQTGRAINGTTFNGSIDIATTEWFHSGRDYPSGTLITTSIDYANTSGDPFVLEIRGNSYGNIIPLDMLYQGYIYSDTIINHGGIANGLTISGLIAINVGGSLCFWFPSQGYWNGYNVKVYTANGPRAINKVTSITGVAKPSGTKEVALSANIRQSLHSGNYSSYALPLSGGILTTGATNNIFIGRNSTASNYNSISLNGSSVDSANMGLTGGGGSDTALYINSPGAIYLRTNGFGYTNTISSYAEFAGSTRSPLFYDSDNTGYYLDPASTSNLAATYIGSHLYTSYSANNAVIQTSATGTSGLLLRDGTGAFRVQMYGDGATYGFLSSAWGSWDIRKPVSGNMFLNNQDTYYYGTDTAYLSRVYGTADIRSPLYYDNNDTGYFIDPNGTSVLHTVSSYYYRRQEAGYGYLDGGYPAKETSSTTGPIYTIGGSYVPSGTSFGNMYGIGYCYSEGIGLGISGASDWGMYVNQGGINAVWLGATGTVISKGQHRGTIFYDYNDTGYYIDPNSDSNTALRMRGGALFGPNTSWGAYLAVGGNGNQNTAYASVAATDGNLHMDAKAGCEMYLNYYAGTAIRAYGSLRTPIMYDLDNTAYYVDPNSISVIGSVLVGGTTASYPYEAASNGWITFGATTDTANYSIKTEMEGYNGYYSKLRFKWYTGIQHYASPTYGGHRFYDITGTEYFGIAVNTGNNYSYSNYSHRAPIFYDLDNTNYYVDPNGTSRINSISADVINSYGNVTAYASSDRKFKTNIRSIPNALEIVKAVGGKLFDWTDEYIADHGGEDGYFLQKADFGVVAQDLEPHLPEAVKTRADGSLAVDYEKLCAVAFEAIRVLEERVATLEKL